MMALSARREALKSAEFHRLAATAIGGERTAVAELLAALRPELLRYCSARAPGRVVEDIVQEICLGVLQALPHYGGRPEDFLAFVYGIAGHKVSDWHRRFHRDRSSAVADVISVVESCQLVDSPLEHRITQMDLVARLRPAIDGLPWRQRSILVLRYVNGLTYNEIGEALGGTSAAARLAHHRAMVVLRSHVAGLDCR